MKKTSLTEVINLKCEYKTNPLGIDEVHPRLSWILISRKNKVRGIKQKAYRILVSSTQFKLNNNHGDLWDSEKIISDQTSQIVYDGKKLFSKAECWWKVKIWDQDNIQSEWSEPAFWKMGLLKKSDWKADWIGYDKIKNEVDNKYSFDKNVDRWIWHKSKKQIGDFYFRKEFDIKNIKEIESAKILISADEKFILNFNGNEICKSDNKIFSWTRPQLLELNSYLIEGKNLIAVEGINSYLTKPGLTAKLYLKYKNQQTKIIKTNSTWKSSNKYYDGWNKLIFDTFKWKYSKEVALMGEKPWRTPDKDLTLPPPIYLRKTFKTEKKIKNAYVFISSLGLYNLSINGEQITKDKLTPGWTDYNRRVNYFTYDVTSYIKNNSKNTLGIILADGWYSGYLGWERKRSYYVKNPKAILQLEIEYEDGELQLIKSDNSWKVSHGPIEEADILMGETYDARKEKLIHGWNKNSFDETKWNKVNIYRKNNIKFNSHPGNPIRILNDIFPQNITSPSKGILIFDLGQNFAGFVRIKINGTKTQKIVLRFGEILNEDGSLYSENIRMARATDTYFTKGEVEEIWEPLFTYHGFRYVEVKGLNEVPANDTIVGRVIHSDMPRTGMFTSSNKLLNKIYENIIWSQKSNFMDIPTDCPQRDERLGWTADAIDFIKTAAFNFDVSAFYTKWLQDLNDAQENNGAYPAIAPKPDFGVGPLYSGAPGFADAGIITPYMLYKFYGDKTILKKYYLNMQRYIKYLIKNSQNYIRPNYGYGDWLSVDAETSNELIGTAFFAYVVKLMIEISRVVGQKKQIRIYKILFSKIKKAFNKTFVLKDGQLKDKTQTAYLLAINFNLLSKEKSFRTFQYLIEDLKKRDWHLSTGFIGLRFLLPTLSKFNRDDIAYMLLLDESFPSWGFMIKNGATTMWERWNSYLPDKGVFDPLMNSFNHTSLGVIGEWFYSNIGGINFLKEGFKEITIKPRIGKDVTFANTTYYSIHGKIVSNWKIENQTFKLQVSIPPNTKAFIYIYAKSKKDIKENNIPVTKSSNVKYIKKQEGYYIFKVDSGEYNFTSIISNK